MILFIMLFLIVYVIQVIALWAFFYVTPAVSEVGRDLVLGELL